MYVLFMVRKLLEKPAKKKNPLVSRGFNFD